MKSRDPLATGSPLSRYAALYDSVHAGIVNDTCQRGPVPCTDHPGQCEMCDALTEVGLPTPCRECERARELETEIAHADDIERMRTRLQRLSRL